MAVVTVGGLVLDVSRVDGDTTRLFLGSLVDLVVVGELGGTLGREDLGDSSGQGGLSMINMAWRDALERGVLEGDSKTYRWCQCSCEACCAGRPPHSHVRALGWLSERFRQQEGVDIHKLVAELVTGTWTYSLRGHMRERQPCKKRAEWPLRT